MATDEVMKNYFARFIGHEMMFMVFNWFSWDFHKSQFHSVTMRAMAPTAASLAGLRRIEMERLSYLVECDRITWQDNCVCILYKARTKPLPSRQYLWRSTSPPVSSGYSQSDFRSNSSLCFFLHVVQIASKQKETKNSFAIWKDLLKNIRYTTKLIKEAISLYPNLEIIL